MSQTSTQKRGQHGEEAAARFLQRNGYTLVERNWRVGNALRGEIDCIARHGKTLCFVEVKTRASNEHGAPQEAVTRGKQRQLSRLANAYVSLHRLDNVPCRFDVVEVWLPHDGTAPRMALHCIKTLSIMWKAARQRHAVRASFEFAHCDKSVNATVGHVIV